MSKRELDSPDLGSVFQIFKGLLLICRKVAEPYFNTLASTALAARWPRISLAYYHPTSIQLLPFLKLLVLSRGARPCSVLTGVTHGPVHLPSFNSIRWHAPMCHSSFIPLTTAYRDSGCRFLVSSESLWRGCSFNYFFFGWQNQCHVWSISIGPCFAVLIFMLFELTSCSLTPISRSV